MQHKYVTNIPQLKEKRKLLRKNLTPAEAALWRILKAKQLNGVKFRRQFSVGPYILDFYCPSHKLAIELDGAHHYTEEGMANDKVRDAFLKQHGIDVLRVENKIVFENEAQLISLIQDYLNKL